MQVGIMITNGGPHPSDKWAAMTAAHIVGLIEIDEGSTSAEAVAARKAKPRLELDLVDILGAFHANVQKRERAALAAEGEGRLLAPLDPNDGIVDTPLEVAEAVAAAAAKTPFGAHFALPAVKAVVAKIVDDHFGKAIDIERSWFADRQGEGSATVKAYRRARIDFGPRNVHRNAAKPDHDAVKRA